MFFFSFTFVHRLHQGNSIPLCRSAHGCEGTRSDAATYPRIRFKLHSKLFKFARSSAYLQYFTPTVIRDPCTPQITARFKRKVSLWRSGFWSKLLSWRVLTSALPGVFFAKTAGKCKKFARKSGHCLTLCHITREVDWKVGSGVLAGFPQILETWNLGIGTGNPGR